MANKFWWVNEESTKVLNSGYLQKGDTIESRVRYVAKTAASILKRPDLEEGFYNLVANGWMSLSSPIWANFGNDRGLPISCYSSFSGDSVEHIYSTLFDVAMMSKYGGGTAVDFSNLRPKGSKVSKGGESSGVMSFIEPFDSTIGVIQQGGVRRSGMAAYLDINHPEIIDFLKIKDKSHKMQNINTAVVVDDAFMNGMLNKEPEKLKVWAAVLKSRKEKGIPYIFFKDNVNKNKPQAYKDNAMLLKHSNLCCEIMLYTDEMESLVCCLSSMNLELYDEWKDTNAVELAIYFLDAVMQEFIDKSEGVAGLERAHRFAKRQRALGLGTLGWHSYLQKNMIPFESIEAAIRNEEIFKDIFEKSQSATAKLAKEYGEPELLTGYGVRNITTCATAPTTSSSSILGQVSPGIEPYKSNSYTVALAKGSFHRLNRHLINLLKSKKDIDLESVITSIQVNLGSVQHLSCLTDEEKAVFRTFSEIDPNAIIEQAAVRQKYIDQGQSLNLHIGNQYSPKEVNELVIKAWKLGVKSLYYQRGESESKVKLSELSCVNCEA